ncbi:MAG: DUF3551 domain-containing protein [Tardiphaga sp.]
MDRQQNTYMIGAGGRPVSFMWATVMTSTRFATSSPLVSAGLAAAGLAAIIILALTAPPASAAGAQYCIARSSVNGDASYVGNCVYADYQQCLQAAAESRGNCVQNIEYHGAPADAPMPRRTRRAR